ncbi:hypothetical protein [Ureibacillus manganicus]|uniref:hypothetical protein n=1 Tax=Ureibacillus manganicus TaxID=1266064 RepID=UPI0011250DA0|nr:hypothetical protein [Ureibacillus manganicus]
MEIYLALKIEICFLAINSLILAFNMHNLAITLPVLAIISCAELEICFLAINSLILAINLHNLAITLPLLAIICCARISKSTI